MELDREVNCEVDRGQMCLPSPLFTLSTMFLVTAVA